MDNKEQQKDEIILIVKKAIADNAEIDVETDTVTTDCNGCDHIAEQVAKEIYNAGNRKVPKYAVILTPEEREEEMKLTNEILAERDELKAENWRLTEKLRQVLLSIDTVKKMNTMCDIDEQRKQAVMAFAEKVKEHSERCYEWDIAKIVRAELDNVLLKEYEVK